MADSQRCAVLREHMDALGGSGATGGGPGVSAGYLAVYAQYLYYGCSIDDLSDELGDDGQLGAFRFSRPFENGGNTFRMKVNPETGVAESGRDREGPSEDTGHWSQRFTIAGVESKPLAAPQSGSDYAMLMQLHVTDGPNAGMCLGTTGTDTAVKVMDCATSGKDNYWRLIPNENRTELVIENWGMVAESGAEEGRYYYKGDLRPLEQRGLRSAYALRIFPGIHYDWMSAGASWRITP
ncbi:hypothetical protein ABT390_36700 [Streptomyces aurantiacus]|uniref:hypothetical protein n=1 Tax=Streptomyces aurantiacus TaxID=47760 RepID=UPI001319D3A3|nr:hypothetical protein [Streptomyces aurantiacus]